MIDEAALAATHSEVAYVAPDAPLAEVTRMDGLAIGLNAVTIDNWPQYRDAGFCRKFTGTPEDVEQLYGEYIARYGTANVASGQAATLLYGWPVATTPSEWWKAAQIDKFITSPYRTLYVWEPPAPFIQKPKLLVPVSRQRCVERRQRLRSWLRRQLGRDIQQPS